MLYFFLHDAGQMRVYEVGQRERDGENMAIFRLKFRGGTIESAAACFTLPPKRCGDASHEVEVFKTAP